MNEPDNGSVLLIDANALFHRAYHAYPSTLTDGEGRPVNAVFGFATLLINLAVKHNPNYMIALFDTKAPTFRHKKYAEYKAHRKPMDAELVAQLPMIHATLSALGIPEFEMEGFEADDLLGSLAMSLPIEMDKTIVSGDQDLLQTIDDQRNVSVYLAGYKFSQGKIFREADVQEKYSFSPKQVIDYKAILGDSSDNIPGVPGVGKKGAADLLAKFSSIEEVYESIDSGDSYWEEKPGKRMLKKLIAGRESAFLSKDLATITCDIEVNFDIETSRLEDYDPGKLAKFLVDFGFKSLYNKAAKLPGGDKIRELISNGASEAAPESRTPQHVAQNSAQSKPQSRLEHGQTSIWGSVVGAEEKKGADAPNQQAAPFFEGLPQLKLASISQLLSDGGDESGDEVNSDEGRKEDRKSPLFCFVLDGEVFLARGGYFHQLDKDTSVELMQRYPAQSLPLVVEDWKLVLKKIPGFRKFENSLSDSLRVWDLGVIEYLLGGGINNSKNSKNAASQANGEASRDSLITAKLEELMMRYDAAKSALDNPANEKLKELYCSVELPLISILSEMEERGIALDLKVITELTAQAKQQLQEVEERIYQQAGETFNVNSPKQVGEILFGKLRLQEVEKVQVSKTKSGNYSTDERTLQNFSGKNSLVADILRVRELSKLISTYLLALPEQVAEDGRVHSSFNQTITATGRLSSSEPNLQNIPVSGELGKNIRKAFVPGEGRKFLAFDYAQQELRLLAHLSGEDKLITAFLEGDDVHALTASEILGVPLAKVSKSERRIGKTVNFGVIYGISGFGLADRLKIGQNEAREFISAFYAKYPKIDAYFSLLKQQATEKGYLETMLGRRKDTQAYKNANYRLKSALEREMLNFPLQGSAADIIKLAMVELERTKSVKDAGLELILQVHDELIYTAPEGLENLDELTETMKSIMESVVKLSVPVAVDVEIGDNWYEL